MTTAHAGTFAVLPEHVDWAKLVEAARALAPAGALRVHPLPASQVVFLDVEGASAREELPAKVSAALPEPVRELRAGDEGAQVLTYRGGQREPGEPVSADEVAHELGLAAEELTRPSADAPHLKLPLDGAVDAAARDAELAALRAKHATPPAARAQEVPAEPDMDAPDDAPSSAPSAPIGVEGAPPTVPGRPPAGYRGMMILFIALVVLLVVLVVVFSIMAAKHGSPQ